VALGRQREVSLQSALGAPPGRLVRRALTENLLLSLVAGGVALALAGPVSARLGSYFARPTVWNMDVARESPVDLRVVAFAIGLSLATGLVAGLLPAVQALRRNLIDALKPEGRPSGGGPLRLRGLRLPGSPDLLVAAQVGLAVVLLVVAGLVLRTLAASERLDPGFSHRQLVLTHISTSSTTIEVAGRDRFFRDLPKRLAEEPWVRSATVADYPPVGYHRQADLRLDGRDEPESLVYSNVVPGFFEALGIDVLRGRAFTDADEAEAPAVAVINRALAGRYFEDLEAVGRRIWFPGGDGRPDRPFEIVGVVADTRTRDLFAPPEPTVYFSYPQQGYSSGAALLVTVESGAAAAVPTLRRWLRDDEPYLAIVNVVPFTEVVRGLLFTQRMNAEMFSGLALLGLALAAVGIFSVVALAVRRRTREIGVRMSIGARRLDIGRWVVGRALVPVGIGLVVGLVIAFGVTRLVRSLLFGVEPTDPASLAGGIGVLIAAALLAAWVPARRAARIDPSRALRHE
jgi:predicted permease